MSTQNTIKVSDSAQNEETYSNLDDAMEGIASWFEYLDEFDSTLLWRVDHPRSSEDLQKYADEVSKVVAEEMLGEQSFYGHGNYSVSPADRASVSLYVELK